MLQYEGVIPYVFIQAYLSNKKEYKIVCINGVPLYELTPKIHKNSKSFSDVESRKYFAQLMIEKLKEQRPEALISGLVRVDIMWCSYLNRMIVNEFESLEAMHDPKNSDVNNGLYGNLYNYLCTHYYGNMLVDFVNKHLSSNFQRLV